MTEKLKFGFYWAASCGGCEIAVLDINEKILDVLNLADIVFWPVAMDTKYEDVEKFPDKFMDVCFFNGSVRNSEQEHLARLLRQKAKVLVAFGSCAHEGCIPGLANLHTREKIFQQVYKETFSTTNEDGKFPLAKVKTNQKELTIPEFYDLVLPLDKVVEVDYYLPGCPPPVPLILDAITAISQNQLPEKGTVLAPTKALCEECERNTNQSKKMPDIKRTYEIKADPKVCFLEQGIICMGPATRMGCQTRCINANWPCTGCMGPIPEVLDQGAKMISALGSILKVDEEKNLTEADVENLIKKIKDPVGTFYMYGLAASIINRSIRGGEK
jgi:F420-non-reducing hydrogenase small subunit|uniref:Oxidoreductase n=1 Tax=candidate division WOR-3 bacterium TaxID=2052148 RepID=A0A7C6A8H3_UNCW3